MRNYFPRVLWAALLLFALGLQACSTPSPTPTPPPRFRVSVTGDPTLHPLLQQLAEAYRASEPGLGLQLRHGNSVYAFDALGRGETDLALVTRPLELAELVRIDSRAIQLGRDGLALVVNPENSLAGLTREQAVQVFSGEIQDWSKLNARLPAGASSAIAVVVREEGSGTRRTFETELLDKRRLTPLALIQVTERSVLEYVSAQPDAIGYASFRSLSSRVKPLNLDGVSPSRGNLSSGKYPLWQPVFVAYRARAAPEVAGFIEFLHSDGAAQIAQQQLVR